MTRSWYLTVSLELLVSTVATLSLPDAAAAAAAEVATDGAADPHTPPAAAAEDRA